MCFPENPEFSQGGLGKIMEIGDAAMSVTLDKIAANGTGEGAVMRMPDIDAAGLI